MPGSWSQALTAAVPLASGRGRPAGRCLTAQKPDCYDIYVINYGSLISGCDQNADHIENWFEENTVLGYIEPFKRPEQNETFGAF